MKEPNKPTPEQPLSIGGLLGSLATGDNVSKILLGLIILLSGGGIWNTSREGRETRDDVLAARKSFFEAQAKARAQVKVIYDNQRSIGAFMRAVRADHAEMMQKLGLQRPNPVEPPPLETLPEDDYIHPNE